MPRWPTLALHALEIGVLLGGGELAGSHLHGIDALGVLGGGAGEPGPPVGGRIRGGPLYAHLPVLLGREDRSGQAATQRGYYITLDAYDYRKITGSPSAS